MNYPGDIPPRPEERAAYRLAANAAWLARAKAAGRAPGGAYSEFPQFEQADEKLMERDNQTALEAARKEIEAERKARKCYICGRRNLPRYSRFFMLTAVLCLGTWWLGAESPSAAIRQDVVILGYLGVAALGAAVGAAAHEKMEPDDEEAMRAKFWRDVARLASRRVLGPE